MRAVIQRVRRAEVRVGDRTVGEIGKGLLVLLGVEVGDTDADLDWIAKKVAELRIFGDSEGKMNLSVQDVGGAVLVVSQFTLLGDCRKGRRPSFDKAAPPSFAEPMYEAFADKLKSVGIDVQTGEFAAMMEVELVNDGPVTLVLDSRRGSGSE